MGHVLTDYACGETYRMLLPYQYQRNKRVSPISLTSKFQCKKDGFYVYRLVLVLAVSAWFPFVFDCFSIRTNLAILLVSYTPCKNIKLLCHMVFLLSFAL
jgi:hypothetical protein